MYSTIDAASATEQSGERHTACDWAHWHSAAIRLDPHCSSLPASFCPYSLTRGCACYIPHLRGSGGGTQVQCSPDRGGAMSRSSSSTLPGTWVHFWFSSTRQALFRRRHALLGSGHSIDSALQLACRIAVLAPAPAAPGARGAWRQSRQRAAQLYAIERPGRRGSPARTAGPSQHTCGGH
jgi:hypothetical protein